MSSNLFVRVTSIIHFYCLEFLAVIINVPFKVICKIDIKLLKVFIKYKKVKIF